jgi:lipopolysaccharide/colanic/teichoic acid biosynthesis glycosyltransferase
MLLLVSIAILSTMRSPVVFKQTRVGKDGATFVVYKFRTMIRDRRCEIQPYDGVDRRLRHKSAEDPRVSKVGRFLRKTSLDEVPQLINVVRGEMALVGPRPELVEIVERYQPWQHQRHLVRPGLTGWWQVHGRSDRPMHENTEMDLHYIAHMSPVFDLRIMLRTFRVVLLRSGAF